MGDGDQLQNYLAEALGEEGDDELVDDDGEGDSAELSPAPPFAEPLPASPSRPVAAPAFWCVPILSGDKPAEFAGPFYRTDEGGGPLLDVYEYVQSQAAVNQPAKWARGPWLDFVTHDVTEDQLQALFGDGHYVLGLRGAKGHYLAQRGISVGRTATPTGRVGRGAARREQARSADPDAPPAWAQALVGRLEAVEQRLQRPTEQPGSANLVKRLEDEITAMEAQYASLERVREGMGRIAERYAKRAEPEDDEEEEGFFDGVASTLGDAVSGVQKAKQTLENLQLILGGPKGG